MIKIFTQNDVIRYFYNETSEEESKNIEQALIIDSELMEMYNQLVSTEKLMNKIQETPTDRVINRILEYSKSAKLDSVCK